MIKSLPSADDSTPGKFHFPYEIREFIVLALFENNPEGYVLDTVDSADIFLQKEIEEPIGKLTKWKNGEMMFGEHTDFLPTEIVKWHIVGLLGHLMSGFGVDANQRRKIFHNKPFSEALRGAADVFKIEEEES